LFWNWGLLLGLGLSEKAGEGGVSCKSIPVLRLGSWSFFLLHSVAHSWDIQSYFFTLTLLNFLINLKGRTYLFMLGKV